MSQRTPKSPWQKYAKTAKKYSANYTQWRDAIMKGNTKAAAEFSCAHAKQFGYRREDCMG
jgi:hypothetical protein